MVVDKIKNKPYNELDELERWMLFIFTKDANTRKEVAKGMELLEKMDEFAEMYVNDEKTKELYGKWGEYIALEKGKRQGIEERNIEIAKSLLELNMNIEDISKVTKLSIKEIEELKNQQ